MRIDYLEFKGHSCFVDDFASCISHKPITVIVGRNNSGKSRLLDLLRIWVSGLPRKQDDLREFRLTVRVRPQEIARLVPSPVDTAHILSRSMETDGSGYSACDFKVTCRQGTVTNVELPSVVMENLVLRHVPPNADELKRMWQSAISSMDWPHLGCTLSHVSADRDVRPEVKDRGHKVKPTGEGATNLIWTLLLSDRQERELVRTNLLNGLNEIFGEDGGFSEITVREDDREDDSTKHTWEIFLAQDRKGLVRLSQSGSGLKTVILVILQLNVISNLDGRSQEKCIFVFEELENNLHPAVLRRLITYIEEAALRLETSVYLTTHSNVVLDVLGQSRNAATVQVVHDGVSARSKFIDTHFDSVETLTLLGARPSDLLQANGVIWVEGPSDRIYVNAWLRLATNGRLREGRDYACAYFGGSILSNLTFVAPGEEEDGMNNLLSINGNVALIADSDQVRGPAGAISDIKQRLRNAKDAVEASRGFVWITRGKEIETYWDGRILAKVASRDIPLPDPQAHERIFESKRNAEAYVTTNDLSAAKDKVAFAAKYADSADLQSLDRMDLRERITELTEVIDRWNGRLKQPMA